MCECVLVREERERFCVLCCCCSSFDITKFRSCPIRRRPSLSSSLSSSSTSLLTLGWTILCSRTIFQQELLFFKKPQAAKPNQTDSYLSTLAVQNQHFSTFRILCAFGYSNPYVGYVRVTFSRSLTTCTSIVLVLYWYLGQDQQYSQIPEKKPQQNLMSITLALMALVELRIYQLVAQSHGSTYITLPVLRCYVILGYSRQPESSLTQPTQAFSWRVRRPSFLDRFQLESSAGESDKFISAKELFSGWVGKICFVIIIAKQNRFLECREIATNFCQVSSLLEVGPVICNVLSFSQGCWLRQRLTKASSPLALHTKLTQL